MSKCGFYSAAVFAAMLCMSCSARAVTFTDGAGTQTDPSWSVSVDTGITLVESHLFVGATAPSNQGYDSGHILDWIQDAGFPNAALVTDGRVDNPTKTFSGTTADLFGVHFGCGKDGPCELVWLFSGNTTFTVNTLVGFSNISAFGCAECGSDNGIPPATPLPAAVWLLGSVLAGGAGVKRWRKRRAKRAALAAA